MDSPAQSPSFVPDKVSPSRNWETRLALYGYSALLLKVSASSKSREMSKCTPESWVEICGSSPIFDIPLWPRLATCSLYSVLCTSSLITHDMDLPWSIRFFRRLMRLWNISNALRCVMAMRLVINAVDPKAEEPWVNCTIELCVYFRLEAVDSVLHGGNRFWTQYCSACHRDLILSDLSRRICER